jgi:uncharacterized linocin/CFP29 family protein
MKIIGAEELVKRGVSDLAQLRPVLSANVRRDQEMVANATLRKDEWEQVDSRVNDVMRERLTIADDLRALGLVSPQSIGTLLRVTERLSDFEEAEVNFDGDTAPQKDRPNYSKNVIPIPVISKDFEIGWRQLDASRRGGSPLDVTAAGIATRKVRDRLQKLITNGFSGGPGAGSNSSGGTSIPGLTTASNRLQVSLANVWDGASQDIIGDTQRMLEAAYAVNLFGPFYMYVPKNYWAAIQMDYILTGGNVATQTYMERILSFVDIKAVRPLDTLADDNVLLVQMTEDVIDLSEAQVVTTVQWEKNPFVTLFRVLSVAGPQIKDIETQDGQTINGIIHLS